MKKIRYYSSFDDDFEETKNQNYILPNNYKWIKKDLFSCIISGLTYGLAIIFGGIYCKLFLHIKIRGKRNLKGIKNGFFIYGNHTQPVGDVFIPALCAFPKRIYTLVSTANYGIPFIGKILPSLGALPIVNSLYGIKQLNEAIKYRISQNHPIVIYPEAHVWEYYTDIRPFPDTSFRFPIKLNKLAFAMTVTYKKSKLFKKPITEVFIDGPFYAEGNTDKEKVRDLHEKIISKMIERSRNSNCRYIEYRQKEL